MEISSDFTKGKIYAPLMRFLGPVLAALLLQTMYGAVDMLVVGRFAAPSDASAVSTGSWLMQLVVSFVAGLAMGTTVLLGRILGEGRPESAGKMIGASIFLFSVVSVAIVVLMEVFAVPIARVMQTPAQAFDATVAYVRICSAGAPFIVAYNVLGSVFRGLGNSKIPLYTVAIACVCNIGGDLLLVAVFGMATAGAAYATVFAQALSVVISLCIIRRQKLPFTLRRSDISPDRERMGEVFRIGFPIAFQDVLVSISFLAISAIVNTLGVIASAGVGVAERLCGFIMLLPSAFGQSIAAFVAQNMGAGKPERAQKALRYSIETSLAAGCVMGYLSFFHGDAMASLFSTNGEVIAAAADYLKAYSIDCIFVSFLFCFIGYFNGCGRTKFVMIQGIVGSFGVRIPVSFAMSRWKPVSLFRVGLATPSSSVVQIILSLIVFRAGIRQQSPADAAQKEGEPLP